MRSEGTREGEQNLGGVFTNLQPRLSFLLDDYFHGWPMCFGYHSTYQKHQTIDQIDREEVSFEPTSCLLAFNRDMKQICKCFEPPSCVRRAPSIVHCAMGVRHALVDLQGKLYSGISLIGVGQEHALAIMLLQKNPSFLTFFVSFLGLLKEKFAFDFMVTKIIFLFELRINSEGIQGHLCNFESHS